MIGVGNSGSRRFQAEPLEARSLLAGLPVPTGVAAVLEYRLPPGMAGVVSRVTWSDVAGEDGYRVEWSEGVDWEALTPDLGPDETSATQSLDAGQKRRYRVRSLLAGEESEPSAVVSPVTPVDLVVGVEAVATTEPPSLALHWALEPGATQYLVSRKTRDEPSWTLLTPTPLPGSAIGYTDTNVSVSDAFEYRVERRAAGTRCRSTVTSTRASTSRRYTIAGAFCSSSIRRRRSRWPQSSTGSATTCIGDGWRVERIDVPRDDDDAERPPQRRAGEEPDPGGLRQRPRRTSRAS